MQGSPPSDDRGPSEAEHLLSEDAHSMEMANVSPESSKDNNGDQLNRIGTSYADDPSNSGASAIGNVRTAESTVPINGAQQTVYRVYKMRWFGLGQLVLLNIVVSGDVSTPTAQRASEMVVCR